MRSEKLKRPGTVRFLQIHLTEHCNLNCKGCSHFSPIAKEKYVDLTYLEKVYINLKPYLEKWFCRLELLGGEPLLHPEIESIFVLTRKHYAGFEVRLVTNGLKLMDMSDRFFELCSKYHIVICMSKYPVNLNYAEIEQKLSKFGVSYRYYGEYETCKTFRQYKLNPSGCYDKSKSFENCKFAGHCFQLRDNGIYPCFISAYAGHLNEYFGLNFRWEPGDYIALDHEVPDEEFMALATEPVPFCKYCNMEAPYEFEWSYSSRDYGEWLEAENGQERE